MDLNKLNSLTKYPSIPTYHQLDKGKAYGDPIYFPDGMGNVIGTEKIDGVNSRFISLPYGGYIIGSREELLYHSGDIIHNPALGIVEALSPVAGKVDEIVTNKPRDSVMVFYFEVYGGNVTAASKNYTSKKEVSFRLFDVTLIEGFKEQMEKPIEQISLWREAGGQPFYNYSQLVELADSAGLQLVPTLFQIPANKLPHKIDEVKPFLSEHLARTWVALDENASKIPEGIIVRTPDRSVIAKMKFRDYR